MDSDAAVSTNCLPVGIQIGEYRVLGVIGEGGFGIVYKALDLALNREVAIKEYMPAALAGRKSTHHVHVRSQHRGAFDAGLRSFINEARLLAHFSHPTLVHVYRFFEAGGTAYMVMRLYEGQTLRRVLENPEQRIDQARLSDWLSPLLDVLQVLHAEDCFHRDIAPDNIFVQHDGSPVLLDFGAARRIIGDMTQALTMVLKPGFAPIEQYVDDGAMPQGAWTDIYQVGALMYLAVTGKTPATSVARMVNDPMQELTSAQAPGFSDVFLQGMHRALAVRPQDRPQTIAELKSLLDLSAPSTAVNARDATASEPQATAPQRPPAAPAPQAVAAGAQPLLPPQPAPPSSIPSPAQSPTLPIRPMDGFPVTVQVTKQASAKPAPQRGASLLDDVAPLDKDHQVLPATPAAPRATASKPAAGASGGTAAGGRPQSPPARSSTAPAPQPPRAASSGRRGRMPVIVGSCVAAAVVVAGLLWFNHSQDQARAAELLQRESLAWQQAQNPSSLSSVQDYLDRFPEGPHRVEAQALMQRLLIDASLASNPREELLPDLAELPPSDNPPPEELPVEAADPVAASLPPEAPEAPRAAPRPVVATGRVNFRIVPWGYVSVNRAAPKISPPMTQMDLPEGEHRIEISNPGAGASATVTRTIRVRKDEPVTVNHLFE